jgi:hypothetical protein
MDIDTFLITLLLDYYEEDCTLNGISYEDFDKMFYDKDGEPIDDKTFFFRNRETLLDDQLIDAVYVYLISNDNKDFQFDRILGFLLSNYFIHNYNNGNNPVVKYFKSNNFDAIKQFFFENYDFGMDLIKSYYRNLGFTERYMENLQQIKNNNDTQRIDEYSKIYSIVNVKTVSVMARNVVTNLYDYYISLGATPTDALNGVWEYFISDLDPLNELEDQYGIEDRYRFFYKRLMLGFIIGDVYEDVCNTPVMKIRSEEDRLAQVVPVLLTSIGVVAIPGDEGTRNKMLNHFLVLQRVDDKKKENRDATYKDDRIKALMKINPLYKLDEFTL